MVSSFDVHQLVVIARPRPDQPYCQLASVFQTCGCAQSILHPCLNALRVLSDEHHQIGILQELAFAADHQAIETNLMLPADQYHLASERKEAYDRYPYITAVLVSSMASCLDHGHNGYCCEMEASFHAVRTAYGDTILGCRDFTFPRPVTVAVIDITNPRKGRYCFLNMNMNMSCIKCSLQGYSPEMKTIIDHHGELPAWRIKDYTPSSGEPLAYRVNLVPNGGIVSTRDRQDVKALEALRAYPLIDVATLASCWPSRAWKSRPASGVKKRGTKSLGQLAEDKIIDALLLGLLDDLELLDHPMLIRGFPRSFLATCAARGDELGASEHQDTIAALLSRLLEGVAHVDLYPFRKLPVDTIRAILRSDHLRDMKSLNLSGLFVGLPAEIWANLDSIPHQPEVIYLLSPPDVDRAKEKIDIRQTIPHYMAGGRCRFWDRMGSKKIIMSASLSTALKSYVSPEPSRKVEWKVTCLPYLRELIRGDTMRLRLWPWMWW